jgi:hypothetical protein
VSNATACCPANARTSSMLRIASRDIRTSRDHTYSNVHRALVDPGLFGTTAPSRRVNLTPRWSESSFLINQYYRPMEAGSARCNDELIDDKPLGFMLFELLFSRQAFALLISRIHHFLTFREAREVRRTTLVADSVPNGGQQSGTKMIGAVFSRVCSNSADGTKNAPADVENLRSSRQELAPGCRICSEGSKLRAMTALIAGQRIAALRGRNARAAIFKRVRGAYAGGFGSCRVRY